MKRLACLVVALFILLTHGTAISGVAIKYGPTSLAFTASSTYGRTNVQAVGAVALALVELPAFTNAVTATFSIINQDGVAVYQKAGLVKGNAYVITDFSVNFPVDGITTLDVTLSGVPGSAGTVTLTLYTLK